MACDCGSIGLDEMFGARQARRDARRFRRRGIERRSRRLLDALERVRPLEGASTLEIGAGVGGVSIEMLRGRGAARARTMDAAPAAVAMARELAAEQGVADRLELRAGDFAAAPGTERFDLVLLDRVVCCYPEWRSLLRPAAAAARDGLAMSYPRESWWSRAGVAVLNGVQALLRRRFRVHVHPPAAMHALLREEGLEPRVVGHEGVWELVVAER